MGAFHIVAGTGRMGTTYIADFLNRISGVMAMHEGHLGHDAGPDLLPMVNLKQLAAYKSDAEAIVVVNELRSPEIIELAIGKHSADILIDVAYYNSVLAPYLLSAFPNMRLTAIVRDCESFVRSATWLKGTDPMPVGWPDPQKPLDARERFIAMGRLRPIIGDASEQWSNWSAIQRNIWLWRETNYLLLSAVERYRDRALLIDFSSFTSDTDQTMRKIMQWIDCQKYEKLLSTCSWPSSLTDDSSQNPRRGGYQIGPAIEWTTNEQEHLGDAEVAVQEKVEALGGYD